MNPVGDGTAESAVGLTHDKYVGLFSRIMRVLVPGCTQREVKSTVEVRAERWRAGAVRVPTL